MSNANETTIRRENTMTRAVRRRILAAEAAAEILPSRARLARAYVRRAEMAGNAIDTPGAFRHGARMLAKASAIVRAEREHWGAA